MSFGFLDNIKIFGLSGNVKICTNKGDSNIEIDFEQNVLPLFILYFGKHKQTLPTLSFSFIPCVRQI